MSCEPVTLTAGPWRGVAVILGPAEAMGSKRIGRQGNNGKAMILDNNDGALRNWQHAVREQMVKSRPDRPLNTAGALCVLIYVSRPSDHWGTGKNAGQLKKSAPAVPAVCSAKDADKVLRAVQDCATGIWWTDDRRIASAWVVRLYTEDGQPERTVILGSEVTADHLRALLAYAALCGGAVGMVQAPHLTAAMARLRAIEVARKAMAESEGEPDGNE